MSHSTAILVTLSLFVCVSRCADLDCERYDIDQTNLSNLCQDNQTSAVTVQDGFKLVLMPNCDITADGCINIRQPIKKALVTFRAWHGGFFRQVKMDGCKESTQSAPGGLKNILLNLVGLGDGCPVDQESRCWKNEKMVNVRAVAPLLRHVQGWSKIVFTVEHESNSSSCLQANLHIAKRAENSSA